MTQTLTPRFDKFPEESTVVRDLIARAGLSDKDRARIHASASDMVRAIRTAGKPGLMEVFLAEYGLSTDEGVALMCLAEALLRVPDPDTIDALIEDKIAPSDWGRHLGHSSSSLVNASTWGLMLTGRVLDNDSPGVAGALRGAIKRLGEPVIRVAARQAMREMGQQFVLGETMPKALARGEAMVAKGYTYSFDMLGEAAMTDADAQRYFAAYENAIRLAGAASNSGAVRDCPGVSVKLSALHPRYEVAQRDRVLTELAPRLLSLCKLAADLGIGLNIDAEEADRLELSFDVIERVLPDPALAGWDGFGVVVQAYGLRASPAIAHLYDLARTHDRKIMVRLVKGAYWDTEIKLAQVEGLTGFPVFTAKAATDVSYLACARQLLGMTDRIYPQFATHNAHSVAAIIDMSNDTQSFEFQRLHGMGEALHEHVRKSHKTRCRIYAPVGAHRDLLAYLVRRLLENGANSSFVNQLVDEDVPPEVVASDPFDALGNAAAITTGRDLYQPERANSSGWDLSDPATLNTLETARAPFKSHVWGEDAAGNTAIKNPADAADIVGYVKDASADDIANALHRATLWDASGEVRAAALNKAANLYEAHAGELFALLAREAGKSIPDAVSELREAVDFLRYYASQCQGMTGAPTGLITCISPWNFPLAIFTGQIAGALAAGCGVLAKPAEQTPLVAIRAVALLHEAGVPAPVLQLLIGDGASVGAPLTSDPRISGVAFTGSTETAMRIRAAMSEHLAPGAPFIAETGGLNAMIVDSTALLEQAVRDVVASAFQSAGQRCSALRCLYVQDDIADDFKTMLMGAMDALEIGNPWALSSDVGPVIDDAARAGILTYLEDCKILKSLDAPTHGTFVAPTLVSVHGIQDMPREIFGPVLHFATFASEDLEKIISDINATGYGLTFGLHTRIDTRVQDIVDRVAAGNVYVNRNQIGAVVGTQPFGGQGLSGTGPKAGGPAYAMRFRTAGPDMPETAVEMPGPTGETNQLSHAPRAPFLCLGPGAETIKAQQDALEALGGTGLPAEGLSPDALTEADAIAGALWWGDDETGRSYGRALAARSGAILPLIVGTPRWFEVLNERHLCVDTTASGGNAALLAEVSEA